MEDIVIENDEDFKKIYDRYFNMVYRIGIIYLKNTSEADDMVQEVFIKLLRYEKKFNSDEHIKAWLIRVSKNQSKDMLKRFWKSRRVDIEKLPEIAEDKENNSLEYIFEQVFSLPKKYRIVLYLYYYEEYSIKEISKLIDKKESTIQSQLARGRERLKNELINRKE